MNELAKNAETILERWNRYVILLDQLSPRVRDPYLSESFKPSCGRIKMVIGDLKALANELLLADFKEAYGQHRAEVVQQIKVTLGTLGGLADKLDLAKRRALEAGGRA